MKTALVLGAGGFIGSHMVKRLKRKGWEVWGVDLKHPEFSDTEADKFIIGDLSDQYFCKYVIEMWWSFGGRDVIFQFAADMGGAGYIFTGLNDAKIIFNSSLINLHVANFAAHFGIKKIVFSSSACVYPQEIQDNVNNLGLKETDAFPANPDSIYGLEKLMAEKIYDSFYRSHGANISICRFHNIFGEESCYDNGKEKFPAAVCRKVAEAKNGDEIEIWGDGMQTRSFLYIDECLDGVLKLYDTNYIKPLNIGSSEMISINDLAKMVIEISGKDLKIKNVSSNAIGVRGRNSDNTLCEEVLGWKPSRPLREGMEKLYKWVEQQVNLKNQSERV